VLFPYVRLVPVPTGTTTEDEEGAFGDGGNGELRKVRARVFAVFVAAPPHKEHLQSNSDRRNARGSKEDRTCMIEGRMES
jgi:hypothetical protein